MDFGDLYLYIENEYVNAMQNGRQSANVVIEKADYFSLMEICNEMEIRYFPFFLGFNSVTFDFTEEKKYNSINNKLDKIKSGIRLKELRKELKLTQLKLATILNTTQSVIADYEKGRYLIATPFLYTICQKYHISADYLLGKIDSPKYLK